MVSRIRILVTGATGLQGGACLRALLAQPDEYELYALTRSARSPAAQKLAASGVHIVEGNMDSPDAVLAQIPRPIDGIFYVSIFTGSGQTPETETNQGTAFFDAAQAAGVRHFVYTSVSRNGFVPTPVPHFASKHAIEAHIIDNARATKWTILQPVAFMDNMLGGGLRARGLFTTLESYVGREKPLQYIATEDIGKFAARTLADPAQYHGMSTVLAGDSLPVGDVQRIYSAHSGASAGTLPHFTSYIFNEWVMPELGKMFTWFRETGYPADSVAQTKRVFPDVMDLETWAKEALARK